MNNPVMRLTDAIFFIFCRGYNEKEEFYMIKLIKFIFVFINGLATGILLLISMLGIFSINAYTEATKDSGLVLRYRNYKWRFYKMIHDDEESVS